MGLQHRMNAPIGQLWYTRISDILGPWDETGVRPQALTSLSVVIPKYWDVALALYSGFLLIFFQPRSTIAEAVGTAVHPGVFPEYPPRFADVIAPGNFLRNIFNWSTVVTKMVDYVFRRRQ